jgi:hypothetical protein
MDNVTSTHNPQDKQLFDRSTVNMGTFPRTTEPCVTAKLLRPEYYGGAENTYEVFNVLEAWELDKDFYLGNVIKYVARAGKKNISTNKEDLQKALVYLQKRIDTL